MKRRLLSAFSLLAFSLSLLAGCTGLPRGGAKTWYTSVGIPGIFTWETENKGVSNTDQKLIAAEHSGRLQILAFVWKNEGTGVVLRHAPPERADYVTKAKP